MYQISQFHFSDDFDEIASYRRLFSEPDVVMNMAERKVWVISKVLYEKFYSIFVNISVYSDIDVNTRKVIGLIYFN